MLLYLSLFGSKQSEFTQQKYKISRTEWLFFIILVANNIQDLWPALDVEVTNLSSIQNINFLKLQSQMQKKDDSSFIICSA